MHGEAVDEKAAPGPHRHEGRIPRFEAGEQVAQRPRGGFDGSGANGRAGSGEQVNLNEC